MDQKPFLVVGSLNTDILGIGVPSIVGTGELAFGGSAKIAPGGKARNVAQMLAAFPDADVRMFGKTGRDPYGLWKVPVDALREAGVDIDGLIGDERSMPGIALIPVDGEGRNQIYVLPGANSGFSPDDVLRARDRFEKVYAAGGCVILSLEIPPATAMAVASLCADLGIPLLVDPGGIIGGADYGDFLKSGPLLVKPNVHEAALMTGVLVVDRDTARAAADSLRAAGAHHVVITAGADGAYAFAVGVDMHVPATEISRDAMTDETGCGDQAMAVLSYGIAMGWPFERAVRCAVRAAGIQFQKSGVQPLSFLELQEII